MSQSEPGLDLGLLYSLGSVCLSGAVCSQAVSELGVILGWNEVLDIDELGVILGRDEETLSTL